MTQPMHLLTGRATGRSAGRSRLLFTASGLLCVLTTPLGASFVGVSAAVASPATAAQKQPKTTRNPRVAFNPPYRRAPRETRGGSSRGDLACATGAAAMGAQLMPLLPNSQYGLTMAERPTLFAYIPATSAQELFVTLKDDGGSIHYQAILPMARQGVVAVELPDAPPLVPGKSYEWGIALMCGGKLRPDSPFISGWVERATVPEISANLPISLETAAIYANSGIWYDTLAVLVTLKQQQPYDLELDALWHEFLGSVGLEAVATRPFSIQLSNQVSSR
jgi:hypothetical protein